MLSEGAMLQLDGSPHDWLEGRGPRLCLIGAIDDATGKVPAAVFREYEDAQGYFLLMRWIVKKYGIPQTVYRDRHGIFERDPKQEESIGEQLEGKHSTTQFGRLMEELGIGEIAANSPQAKGRIERLWGTLQDRLVSELRLANASTINEANDVLKTVIADHNMRFHRLPGDPQSLYRKLDKAQDPEKLFCFKYKRSVARDNTVAFFSRTIQIGPGPGGRSYAGRWVDVHQCFDGSLHVYHDGNCLAKTAAPSVPPPVIRVRHANGRCTQECPWTAPRHTKPDQDSAADPPTPKQRQPHKPAPDHPWRRTWVTKSQTS